MDKLEKIINGLKSKAPDEWAALLDYLFDYNLNYLRKSGVGEDTDKIERRTLNFVYLDSIYKKLGGK